MTFFFLSPPAFSFSFFFNQLFISLVVLATRALLYRARQSPGDPGGRGRAKRASISWAANGGFLGQGLSRCLGPAPAR